MTATKFNTKATPKQIAFILDLLDGRELQLGTGQTVEQLKEQAENHLTKAQASAWIERLKSLPRKQRSDGAYRPGPEPKAGMYRRESDDAIIRVYLGQQSGRMLSKQLVGDDGHYEWDYLGLAAKYVSTGCVPLSLEEAKEFGRMSGTCCVCARRLDVPESVDAGIGPVCAGRMRTGDFK